VRSTPALLLCAVALLVAGCGGATAPSDDADAVSAPSAAAGSSLRVERSPDGGAADGDEGPVPQRSQSAVAAPDPGASGSPTSPASPPAPDASEPASSVGGTVPRAATVADAARFIARVQPQGVRDLDGVAVDLDRDGTHEVVLSGVRDERGWLALAAWEGRGYRVVAEGLGGPADRVVQVSVADVNGDDQREVVLEVGGDGAGSLALWRVPARIDLVPLRARGGCHDGSHVYGAVGARLVAGSAEGVLDVAATCDDAPLPRADWGTQRWSWDGEAYRHVPERPGQGAGNGPPPGTPSVDAPGRPSDTPPSTPRGEPAAEGD